MRFPGAAQHVVVHCRPGIVTSWNGGAERQFGYLLEGELEVIKESAVEGKEGIVISTLSKGQSIGEMSVIEKTPRSATVRARTATTVLTLSADGFDIILEKHPRIGIKILKGISRLLSMNLRKTSARLAEYMLPLS